jgi:hypothetical protein
MLLHLAPLGNGPFYEPSREAKGLGVGVPLAAYPSPLCVWNPNTSLGLRIFGGVLKVETE